MGNHEAHCAVLLLDYLGDRGYTQGTHFDLNEQNVCWCVTPEYPSGTFAYFTTLNADGTPAYPYTTGRQDYGNPTGGASAISETVTTFFDGGPNRVEKASAATVNSANGNVTMTWSAVEGGTYLVEASDDLVTWPDLTSTVMATDDQASMVETGAKTAHPQRRFYRVSRMALASFDSNGFDYTAPGTPTTTTAVSPGGTVTRGTTVAVTLTLPTTPPAPPVNVLPTSITLDGTVVGTNISRPSATTILATFVIPSGMTTGTKFFNIVFSTPGPPPYTTLGITVN